MRAQAVQTVTRRLVGQQTLSESSLWSHPGLLAVCIALPMIEVGLLWGVGLTSALGIAPSVTAPVPFATFHDLRWLMVYHRSWLGCAVEALALLAFRGALTALLVRLAWPGGVARPSPAVLIRNATVFTLVSAVLLMPWVGLLFGLAVMPVSWLFFVAVPPVLAVGLLIHHRLVRAGRPHHRLGRPHLRGADPQRRGAVGQPGGAAAAGGGGRRPVQRLGVEWDRQRAAARGGRRRGRAGVPGQREPRRQLAVAGAVRLRRPAGAAGQRLWRPMGRRAEALAPRRPGRAPLLLPGAGPWRRAAALRRLGHPRHAARAGADHARPGRGVPPPERAEGGDRGRERGRAGGQDLPGGHAGRAGRRAGDAEPAGAARQGLVPRARRQRLGPGQRLGAARAGRAVPRRLWRRHVGRYAGGALPHRPRPRRPRPAGLPVTGHAPARPVPAGGRGRHPAPERDRHPQRGGAGLPRRPAG